MIAHIVAPDCITFAPRSHEDHAPTPEGPAIHSRLALEVGVGDEMKVISRDPNGVPVSEITRLYAEKRYSNSDVASVQQALRVAALPESWKEYFRHRLKQIPTSG